VLPKKWNVIPALLVLVLAAAGCETDDVDATMGARCTGRSDCAERCLEPSATYPGGMCTVGCGSDAECRSDAVCIVALGSVCMYSCRDDDDCAFLGSVGGVAWTCQEPDAGKKVCLGPGE
jgi:hypothetical protein